MSLVIKGCKLLGREGFCDVMIDGEKIVGISEREDGEEVIEARGKYLIPGFVNTHTHAAMSLMRGYADDLPLQTWLSGHIWPLEGKLTDEDVYWGTKLACLEMIKTGTVAFNDMYFYMESAADAICDMGMKATLAYGLIDLGDQDKLEEEKAKTQRFIEEIEGKPNIKSALGPHAVYTVSEEGLAWCGRISKKKDIPVHMHLAETRKEMDDFKKEHDVSITEYLDDVDLLNDRLIAAHCVWLEEEDIEDIANASAIVSHNPVSNMKLGVGKPMDYTTMRSKDVTVTLGTDGCASNNNLDILESVKIATLQQKLSGDPTVLPAVDAYGMITLSGASALGTGGGTIEEGKAADMILVEKGVCGVPGHNPISDIIYSLNGSNVTHTIINGRIIMKDRYVKDEEEILKKATEVAARLVKEVR